MGIEKRPIERFNFYTVQPYTQTLVGESVGLFLFCINAYSIIVVKWFK